MVTGMSSKGTLLIVLGLAGSGKSHLIDMLTKDFVIEEGFALDENNNVNKLAEQLDAGRFCIVSERKYRSQKERDDFLSKVKAKVQHAPFVNFLCFEKDKDAANHNCMNRTNKNNGWSPEQHVQQNETDFTSYEIPDGAVVVKIHRTSAKAEP